jgi:hypothetical protein
MVSISCNIWFKPSAFRATRNKKATGKVRWLFYFWLRVGEGDLKRKSAERKARKRPLAVSE